VTLAHVARPAALFETVDPQRFEAYFACDLGSRRFLTIAPEKLLALPSIVSELFTERLHHGRPLYDTQTLHGYVIADLALIERVKPDLIVGDFRLSLSVSARVAQVPYASITNAYWSPYSRDLSLPLPVLPWTRYVPIGLAQRGFDLVQTLVLSRHCGPLNDVREAYGLRPLPTDLRSVYTDADHVLYADSPRLFPLPDAPSNHRHLGPVLWSPPGAVPAWWHDVPDGSPLIYVTMGSSGNAQLLQRVIDGHADMDLNVIASTAGAPIPRERWRNVWIADYLPGNAAAARASLVVCNGGSPTSQQALAAGRPVLGICGNMDQFLNMRGLQGAGAGLALRADRLTARALQGSARALLGRGVEAGLAPWRPESAPRAAVVFDRFLDEVFGSKAPVMTTA
jgi:UDP:flavonoid glycosyltransferase YjiC (YdhE family)